MAIINGQTPNADEVMNAFGRTLKIYSNLVWNSDLIGFDSDLVEDFENYMFDSLKDSTKIDTTNSDIDDVPIYGALVSDDFEDASIDANIWSTSGVVGESGGKLNLNPGVSATATATADQINSIDFRNSNTNSTVLLKWDITGGTGSGGPTNKLILTDGSASVDLISTATGSTAQDVRLEINPGTNNVQVHTNDINGDGAGSAIDITSLSDVASWSIKFSSTQTDGSDFHMEVYFLRYLLNSIVTPDFISDSDTSSSTITNAILVVSDEQTNGSIDYFLSADNGSNYESVTPNEIHRFTSTGTQLKVKATLNSTADKVPIIYHYAAQYNYY